MRINTNVSSLTAQEANVNTNNSLANSLEKLSSGLKINKAADDASGLAIADKLRTQATSINQGVDNGNSAVALLQIADKSMAEQSNILDTVKAKLIQANTDTTSADGREAIRKDIAKLLEQLDNIAKQTNYNGTTLLQASRADDSASSGLSFQVGENDGDLITNTSIQSNTQGLAGAELSVAAAATAGTDDLSTGDAQLVKHGGTTTAVTLTAASGTASVSLSGKVGVLGAASGESLTISNVSSADKLQLDALAVSNADFTNNNDGTYTLTNGSAASTLDLGSYNVNSITVDSSTTIISLTGDTANDRFSVQNLATAVTTIAGGDTGTTIGL
jgi:flagellin